jgi:putative hydrolase of the HAD superfamily
MSLEAVIFDWGGTLSHYAEVELADMWQLAAERLSEETGRDVATLRAALSAGEVRYWKTVNEHQHTGTLGDILRSQAEALGLDVAAALLGEVAQRHLDAWTPHIRHHRDARDALCALRAQGLKIGLLSNTHWPDRFLEHFLGRDGLAELIDVRAYTSHMEHSKPHPEAYLHVLRALDVAPEAAAMVGDRPRDDVWGAQRIGMCGVFRPHAHSPVLGDVVPDATIQTLSELPSLTARWRDVDG